MLMKKLWFLQEEAPGDGADAGGGGGGDGGLDIAAAVDQIGADLGFGADDKGEDTIPTGDDTTSGSATPSPKGAPASAPTEVAKKAREFLKELVDPKELEGADDDKVTKLAEEHRTKLGTPPKAWKTEMHGRWKDIPPPVQRYLLEREAQIEEGFKGFGGKAKFADSILGMLAPYKPLLDSQGLTDPTKFLNNLMVAHNILSTQADTKGAQLLVQLAKNYKVKPEALLTLLQNPGAGAGAEETAAQKALRERMEKLEEDRAAEQRERVNALKAQIDSEVATFRADPAHAYYDEVSGHMALLLADPRVSLKEAYEQAVWANPVTRAKEQARLKEVETAAARKKAEEELQKRKQAKGTTVRGREQERASPAPKGSWDDTMRETLAEIKNRT